jgi:NFACT protein RNA binding domain
MITETFSVSLLSCKALTTKLLRLIVLLSFFTLTAIATPSASTSTLNSCCNRGHTCAWIVISDHAKDNKMISISPSFMRGITHYATTTKATKCCMATTSYVNNCRGIPSMKLSTLKARGCISNAMDHNSRYPRSRWYSPTLSNIYRNNRMVLFFSTKDSNRSNDDVDSDNASVNDKQRTTTTRKTTTATNNNVTVTDSDDEEESVKSMTSLWNLDGLRNEIYRRMDRAHKKIGQYTKRIEKYKKPTDKAPVKESDKLDIDIIEAELSYVRENLKQLRQLEVLLSTMVRSKGGKREMVLPELVAERALALNMTDTPPTRPPRGEPKPKGPRKMQQTRKPYRKYISIDNIEIRVGKKAEDNDELSTNPLYRDGSDWWLHASGCPGSHVIIRDEQPPDTTIQDAAALAASKSKCTGTIIKVTMCRAREIKKPANTKPGLVYILGSVRTVVVDMKEAQKRLERLEASVEVN